MEIRDWLKINFIEIWKCFLHENGAVYYFLVRQALFFLGKFELKKRSGIIGDTIRYGKSAIFFES